MFTRLLISRGRSTHLHGETRCLLPWTFGTMLCSGRILKNVIRHAIFNHGTSSTNRSFTTIIVVRLPCQACQCFCGSHDEFCVWFSLLAVPHARSPGTRSCNLEIVVMIGTRLSSRRCGCIGNVVRHRRRGGILGLADRWVHCCRGVEVFSELCLSVESDDYDVMTVDRVRQARCWVSAGNWHDLVLERLK